MTAIANDPQRVKSLTITASPTPLISLLGSAPQDPATINSYPNTFLSVVDPTLEIGFNVSSGGVRTAGVSAIAMAFEANYANATYQASQRNYFEWYVTGIDAAGKGVRFIAFTGDNGAIDNYLNAHITIGATGQLSILRSTDGSNAFSFGGDGTMGVGYAIQFTAANPNIQATTNTPIAFITNSKYVFISNTVEGLGFGVSQDANLYRTTTATLRTNSTLVIDGVLSVGTASPNANAILDLTSTTKAFMPPRMTTTQRNAIASPTAGMVIYNSTTNKLNVYTTGWEAVTSA